MSTYIGFNLNSNRQIEHFQTIENRYGINSDGGKFLFGQAELALKGSYIPKEEVYLIPYQGAVQPVEPASSPKRVKQGFMGDFNVCKRKCYPNNFK